MKPFTNELLNKPISLPCGVTIREWRGQSKPSPEAIKMMDSLCTKALNNFKPFIESQGLRSPRSGSLSWNWSIVPDGHCYRCLNDTKFRFAERFVRDELWGYTGRDQRYTFTISTVKRPIFKKVFTHEMFHAMSMYYGLYDQHSQDDYVKTETDEQLAEKFVEYMGYH